MAAGLFIGTREELWPRTSAESFKCEACEVSGQGPFIETCRVDERIGKKDVSTRVCVDCLRNNRAVAMVWIDKGWRRCIR